MTSKNEENYLSKYETFRGLRGGQIGLNNHIYISHNLFLHSMGNFNR